MQHQRFENNQLIASLFQFLLELIRLRWFNRRHSNKLKLRYKVLRQVNQGWGIMKVKSKHFTSEWASGNKKEQHKTPITRDLETSSLTNRNILLRFSLKKDGMEGGGVGVSMWYVLLRQPFFKACSCSHQYYTNENITEFVSFSPSISISISNKSGL